MSTKTPRKRKPTPHQATRRPKTACRLIPSLERTRSVRAAMIQERESLEADRRRMDWLAEHSGLWLWYPSVGRGWSVCGADWPTFRAAVDAAMRGAK